MRRPVDLGQMAQRARFLWWRVPLRERPVLRQPIFMIGCPRSGTSIAVSLFGTHPYVTNWSEAIRVWDPRRYDDHEADHHWSAEDVTDRDRRRLHAWFEWYRQTSKKPRFINKHPRSSVRIDYIREVFPDAYFIHMMRDGRAVVSSLLQRMQRQPERLELPFGGFCKPVDWRTYLRSDRVEQAALQWREIVRYARGKRHALGDRYLEFKYEDLCADPRGVLAAACRFAGLPSSGEYLSGIPQHLPNANSRSIGLLTPLQIETIEAVQRDLLAELGYMSGASS